MDEARTIEFYKSDWWDEKKYTTKYNETALDFVIWDAEKFISWKQKLKCESVGVFDVDLCIL